jgi:hypothetical protein
LRAWQRAVAFITGVGGIGHLVVIQAEVVVAEAAMLEAVSMHVVVEQTEANVGISTGYLAWAKLDKFVQRVDAEVTEERVEREARNLLRYRSRCPGIDGWGFGAVVAVAAGVGAVGAVTS